MAKVKREEPKPGETCFGGGSGILIPFAPASKQGSGRPAPAIPVETNLTEEHVQAELARLKNQGFDLAELSMFEEALRAMKGKPKGSG